MSIQAIAWVLDHSQSEGLSRLVLLAIANHADASGWNAWPSVTQIAQEARISRRTVFRCLDELKTLGEVTVAQSGGGRGLTTHYGIPLKRCQERCQPDTDSPVRVSAQDQNGATAGTRNRPEPNYRGWALPKLPPEELERVAQKLKALRAGEGVG